MKILAFAVVACSLALPSIAQEPQETVREELRELTYAEESDRVLAHLVSLLPQARDAAQFEVAVDRWVADLSPADTVNVRHRIDELLREVPERDLYGVLVALVQHRFQKNQGQERTPASSTSAAIGGLISPSPPPLPFPADDLVTIGRVGGQLASAAGDCPRLQALATELSDVWCNANYADWRRQCLAALDQVWSRLSQLLDEADC